MTERVLLRVVCSRSNRPHTVGTVVGTPEGMVLRIAVAVHGRQTTAHTVEFRDGQESGAGYAYCTKCAKALPMIPQDLIERAGRVRFARLDAEGMHRDPVGVLDRQAQRKCQ